MTPRKSLSLILATAILLIGTAAFADTGTPAASGVININTADAGQLAFLPRVGAKAAQRIVDYRTQHGPFHKTSDLMQVKGFGEKSFNRLSAYLAVDGATTLKAKVSGPRKPRSAKASKSHPPAR